MTVAIGAGMKTPKYRVTRKFTGGILNGLTYTSETSVKFDVGFSEKQSWMTDSYVIVSVEKLSS